MSVIVRFAPSPTGMLHIGNARTAIFNYLFAKHHNGKFLLRIEDTDAKRSTEEAIEVIFDGLKWLNLNYDGEAVFQSTRIERHKELAEGLIEKGLAYRCFSTEDEMEILRHDSRTDNEKIIYPDRDNPRFDHTERPFTVRLKTPLDGKIVIQDLIRGEVVIDASELDDMILLRSDGTPTYMHAVVCDDIDMKITHVIRGEDHLINAFRQKILYEALGFKTPEFAHLPLLHGADGAKLSKRHGATSVVEWRELGYMSEMLVNYLITLGWNDIDKDIFSLDEAIKLFDIKRVNNSAARLDNAKIIFLSGLYIRSLSDHDLVQRYDDYRSDIRLPRLDKTEKTILEQAAPLFKERAMTLKEFGQITEFLLQDSFPEPNTKAKELLDVAENIDNLKNLLPYFEKLEDWSNEGIAQSLKSYLADYNIKMPKIGPVVRAAVAGTNNTPDLSAVLAILGKEKTLVRIKNIV